MSTPDLRPRAHDALESLVLFDFRLTCRTGLHIGAGKSADLAGGGLPVLRDGAGRPLAPGTALRGGLRSGVEGRCRPLKLAGGRSLAAAAAPAYSRGVSRRS